jgi:hypothetical protein
MRYAVLASLVIMFTAVLGCAGRDLAGTYRADVRLMEGKQETGQPGYSLAEVRARLAEDRRSLVLHADGRYEWRSRDTVNEGNWKVEGDTLILRDDIQNGIRIQPALQKDRRWRVGEGGEIINEGTYSHYNIEEFYTRE